MEIQNPFLGPTGSPSQARDSLIDSLYDRIAKEETKQNAELQKLQNAQKAEEDAANFRDNSVDTIRKTMFPDAHPRFDGGKVERIVDWAIDKGAETPEQMREAARHAIIQGRRKLAISGKSDLDRAWFAVTRGDI